MTDRSMRTYIHVDDFNLCHGSLEHMSWRWLDLVALFGNMLQPRDDVVLKQRLIFSITGLGPAEL